MLPKLLDKIGFSYQDNFFYEEDGRYFTTLIQPGEKPGVCLEMSKYELNSIFKSLPLKVRFIIIKYIFLL